NDVRTSPDVAEWVAAENKVTDAYLNSIPERDVIRKRLTELWNYEKFSAPSKDGGRYFYSKNDGLQNQFVLYTAERLDSTPRMLIDPNSWSKDGTVALAGTAITDDGKLIAFAKAEAGSDWHTWHALKVDSGELLPDELKWTKFTNTSWTKDDKGFFYSRFPEPKEGETFQSLNVNQKLYYHRLGTPQSEDQLIYTPTDPKYGVGATVTEDGKYLIIEVSDGTTSRKSKVFYKPVADFGGPEQTLIDNFENKWSFIGNDGAKFYFRTEADAPRGRVVAFDTSRREVDIFPGSSPWKEIIPQSADTLTSVSWVGDKFICDYLHDAHSLVKVYTPDGKYVRDVELPGIGTAVGFQGKRSDKETFYTFMSFATPPTIYRYDPATGESQLWKRAGAKCNPDDYEVKQAFVPSKDGTKVPVFITSKKGLKRDGNNPTLLYGYGGFDISMTPQFSVSRLLWVEMGGVYVQACLRGGGEYGEEWHRAGTKLKKQNVFDDCIAVAEWLCKEGYTKPAKLAVQGGSNGGLLVGAVMTQRPDLFGACLPAVGVMDMLRFQKFTAGRYWVDDYGSSDNPEEFQAIYRYSPYHNIKPGVKYPATLVTTADHDDRVVPGHSFKFIARLQECQAGPAPVLARIETRAGHGAGKPTKKLIEETADQMAFLVKNLGMRP
ncbi:MAG TPA: prolyl oligopeptidase family serine peptidase, partial [Gemmataceae bacterium]|nr:prolyl oligopeptidase family serine peptidase [Gemmataceae bacterium]